MCGPSKVMNNTIYDIRVDVEIADPARSVSSVPVAIEPVLYVHLPTEAFPHEETRTAVLQSPGIKETLSKVFSDLRGGREYEFHDSHIVGLKYERGRDIVIPLRNGK